MIKNQIKTSLLISIFTLYMSLPSFAMDEFELDVEKQTCQKLREIPVDNFKKPHIKLKNITSLKKFSAIKPQLLGVLYHSPGCIKEIEYTYAKNECSWQKSIEFFMNDIEAKTGIKAENEILDFTHETFGSGIFKPYHDIKVIRPPATPMPVPVDKWKESKNFLDLLSQSRSQFDRDRFREDKEKRKEDIRDPWIMCRETNGQAYRLNTYLSLKEKWRKTQYKDVYFYLSRAPNTDERILADLTDIFPNNSSRFYQINLVFKTQNLNEDKHTIKYIIRKISPNILDHFDDIKIDIDTLTHDRCGIRKQTSRFENIINGKQVALNETRARAGDREKLTQRNSDHKADERSLREYMREH